MKTLRFVLWLCFGLATVILVQASTAIDGRWISTNIKNYDEDNGLGAGWVVEFRPDGTFTEEIDERFGIVEIWSGTFTLDGKNLSMHRTGFKQAWEFELEKDGETLKISKSWQNEKRYTVTFKRSSEPHAALAALPRWPKTKAEAVALLKKKMSEENLKELASTPKKELIGKYHFGLGMYIRNAFGIWRGNKELWEDLTHGKKVHPDDLSSMIIEALWEDLQESSTAVPRPRLKT